MTLPFKLDYAVVCDHIRREDSGKLILIGVYGSSVLVTRVPLTLSFALAVRMIPKELGAKELEFRVTVDGEEVAKGEIAVTFEDIEAGFIGLPAVPVPIIRTGSMRFEMRDKGAKRWALLAEINVGLRSTSSNAP
jgi:hypothetical protein